MLLVLRLRLDPQITEYCIYKACAAFDLVVDQYICVDPSVSMRRMLIMYFLHDPDHFLAPLLLTGFAAILPFVVAGSAHSHKIAQVFDVIFSGKQLHYFEFFGFKGTYTCSPFSSVFTV